MSSLSDEATDCSSGSLQISDTEIVCTFPNTQKTLSRSEEYTSPNDKDEYGQWIPEFDETQTREMEGCLIRPLNKGELLFFPRNHIDKQLIRCLTFFLKEKRAVVVVSRKLREMLMSTHTVPKKWLYDVYIISPDEPVTILSYVETRCQEETDVIYNTSLSRTLTTTVRSSKLSNFSVVNGVITQEMNEHRDKFCAEVKTFTTFTNQVFAPTSLYMDEARYTSVLKTITECFKKPETTKQLSGEYIELTEGATLSDTANTAHRANMKNEEDLHKNCVDKGVHGEVIAELEDARKELTELRRIVLMRSRSFTSTDTVSSGYVSEEEEEGRDAVDIDTIYLPTTHDYILGRTSADISSFTKGMIKLSVINDAVAKLQAGQKWITITGQAGEGKTTTGFMILKEMESKGQAVFSIANPQEHHEVLEKTSGNYIIFLDDIFGQFDVDPIFLTEWTDTLRNKKSNGRQNSGSCQAIIVVQSNMLEKCIKYLPDEDNSMIDLTNSITKDERVLILNSYLESQGIDCSDEEKYQIASSSSQHGFAHSCRMYSYLKKRGKDVAVNQYFQNPLLYLEQSVKEGLAKKGVLAVVKRMLISDGKLKMADVKEKHSKRAISLVVEDPSINWLFNKSDIIKFAHPSVYASVALAIGRSDPIVAVRDFTLSFIMQKVEILTNNVQTREKLYLNLAKNSLMRHLLRRFIASVKKKNFCVLTHSACHSESFFRNLLKSVLTEDGSSTDSHHLKLKSTRKERIDYHSEILAKLNSRDKVGQTMLKVVATGGNTSALKVLLEFGADVNKLSSDVLNGEYKSVVHHLCEHKTDIGVVDLLLKYKADVNLADKTGTTPLHCICKKEPIDLAVMSLLLTNGALVNMYDESGHTALHVLCSKRTFDIAALDLLIKHGGNVNQTSKGLTEEKMFPLHYICASDEVNTSALEMLIKQGAEVNVRDGNGKTALHYIKHLNTFGRSAVETLLKYGANINLCDNDGKSVLHYQCSQEDVNVSSMEFLIQHKSDVSKCDTDGMTALHYICNHDNVSKSCIEFLISHDADVNGLFDRGFERRSVLHCLFAKTVVDMNIIEFLIESGADLSVLDESRKTVLHYVCAQNNPDVCHINFLVSKGVSVNQADRHGQTALISLCRANALCVDAVQTMLKAETDVDHTDLRHSTALHYLCTRRTLAPDCIELFIKHGADVNVQTEDILGEQTALHLLTQRSDVDQQCLQLLINSDTSVNITDSDGKNALHYLCENEAADKDMIKALLSSGGNIKQCSVAIDGKRKSPLHFLCLRKRVDVNIIHLLLGEGVDVDQDDEKGKTALLHICSKPTIDFDVIKLLVENGASINQCDDQGNSVMHYICRHRHIDLSITKYVLDKSTDVNKTNADRQSALHVACDMKNYDAACLLINHDANINIVDADGKIALHYFTNQDDDNDRTDKDDDEETEESEFKEELDKAEGLTFAVRTTDDFRTSSDEEEDINRREGDLVNMLITKGSDVHKQDKHGRMAYPKNKFDCVIHDPILMMRLQRTDLMRALLEGNKADIHRFLQAGADVTAVDVFGRTALHYLCMSDIDCDDLLLLTRLSNVNKTDNYGNTALHYFCKLGANEAVDVTDVVLTFLQNGLQVNKQDEYGYSILYYLRNHFDLDMIEAFVTNCKKLNEDNGDGTTLLHFLCAAQSSDLLKLVIPIIDDIDKPVISDVYGMYGMVYDVVISKGQTALHLACRSTSHDAGNVVQMLTERKADVNAKDRRGMTPEDYCRNEPSCNFEWTPNRKYFVLPSCLSDDCRRIEVLKLLTDDDILSPVTGHRYRSKEPLSGLRIAF